MDMKEEIQKTIDENMVVLYMKGTKEMPMCGFSNAVTQVMNGYSIPYVDVNVLEDPDIRVNLSEISNWPTIPQLFIDGELVGGCDITLELHQSRGLGAGGDPAMGRRCAEAGRDVITKIVDGADLVFVTAGLGGGTGTGIAPIVAEEAKRSGALVVAVVTTPFTVERRRRMELALEGLELVRKAADAVLVLDNNRLLHFVPNLPLNEAFSIMDQLIAEIVKGVVETITLPSLINLDFADVRSIMTGGGVTMMLYGESDQGPEEVVHESLNHPLLDIEIDGATGALIHVTGGPYMTLEQANQVVDLMTARLSPNANVIFGARQDPAFGDTIKVMSIITGVAHERLGREMVSANMLGEALNIARKTRERSSEGGFQRFD